MSPAQDQAATPGERIAVILPAFNEELTVGETIAAFHQVLPQAAIYVINNNSSDRTAAISREALRSLAVRGAVIDEPRQGKGHALRRAFHDIEADIYLLADADMTYPSRQAPELLAPVREGRADMVVGDRLANGEYARKNRRPFHDLGNRLLRWTVNALFSSRLADVMSGYRAFSRDFVKNYPVLVGGFQIETDMTLHALYHRLRIVEVPIAYSERPPGSSSKLRTFSDGARVLFAIFRILRYYRPLRFFSVLSALFAAGGLLAALPVFHDWIAYRFIYHVPLAILASALEMSAILLFVTGLILDAMAHNQRLAFELRRLERSGDAGKPENPSSDHS